MPLPAAPARASRRVAAAGRRPPAPPRRGRRGRPAPPAAPADSAPRRCRRRAEPERRIRHAQDVRAPGDLHAQVRRHARLQLQLRVRHVDDRRVGRHVLDDDRLQPDLRDRTLELLRPDMRPLGTSRSARPDAADVGLVDVGVHLHLRQVRGDDEERRRLHAGGHRLADVHAALDDDAVDRRRDEV